MKKRFSQNSVILVALLTVLLSVRCVDNDATEYQNQNLSLNLPSEPFNYTNLSLDSKFNLLETQIKSSVTDHGATLGRVLFYDTKLSKNNSVACASCHQQKLGFADNKDFSLGFEGKKSLRNSHGLCNTAIKKSFFWDGRETKMNNLVLQPVRDHIEMGLDNTLSLENRIKDAPYYKELFENAFGTSEITAERISKALSEFVNSIVSTNAPVDDILGDIWGTDPTFPDNFTQEQKEGGMLFFGKAKCASCHAVGSMQQDFGQDIGLESDYTNKDSGFGQINPGQEGIFKIPSLINVAMTAPYMHDGRFKTLKDVVEHYNSKIQNSKNLSWTLTDQNTEQPIRLGLNETEKKSLVAFLSTFTDNEILSHKKYSDPFKR